MDNNYHSAFHYALFNCYFECLPALLTQKTIMVNIQDTKGNTLLHSCTTPIHENEFMLLLEHKDINLNVQNKAGQTALH